MPSINPHQYRILREQFEKVQLEYFDSTKFILKSQPNLGIEDSVILEVSLESLNSVIPNMIEVKKSLEELVKTAMPITDVKYDYKDAIETLNEYIDEGQNFTQQLKYLSSSV